MKQLKIRHLISSALLALMLIITSGSCDNSSYRIDNQLKSLLDSLVNCPPDGNGISKNEPRIKDNTSKGNSQIVIVSLDDETRKDTLQIGSGYLIGTNYGEFGGDLTYVNIKGKKKVVLDENIVSLYKVKNKTIAISGLYHMGINDGKIYEIIEKHGKIDVELLFVLPEAPLKTLRKDSGEIQMKTMGGVIELTNDLKLNFIE